MMKLEQIDTSTTAGKAEVMRLASEGRKCFSKFKNADYVLDLIDSQSHDFDWSSFDYVVVAKPVGPDEVWVVALSGRTFLIEEGESEARDWVAKYGNGRAEVVRYIRADLAGGDA